MYCWAGRTSWSRYTIIEVCCFINPYLFLSILPVQGISNSITGTWKVVFKTRIVAAFTLKAMCQLNVSHLCLFFLHQENTFGAAEENMDNDKPPQSPGSRQSSGQEAVWIPGKNQVETVMKPGRCKCSTKSAQEVDHYVKILNTVEFFSRLLFPIVFIFLNIAYWLYYGGILE